MGILYTIHLHLGREVLPLLTLIAAIYLTVTWKPDAPRSPIARFFPVLIDIQATLGLLWFIFLLMQGDGSRLFSLPLLFHPILGLIIAGVGHMAVGKGPFARLGRWAPLAGLAVVLVLVIINAMIPGIARRV